MNFDDFFALNYPNGSTYGEMKKLQAAFEAGQANPPDGWKLVPISVLKSCSRSLGAFVGDEGWQQIDMDVMDSIDALLATPGKDKE